MKRRSHKFLKTRTIFLTENVIRTHNAYEISKTSNKIQHQRKRIANFHIEKKAIEMIRTYCFRVLADFFAYLHPKVVEYGLISLYTIHITSGWTAMLYSCHIILLNWASWPRQRLEKGSWSLWVHIWIISGPLFFS